MKQQGKFLDFEKGLNKNLFWSKREVKPMRVKTNICVKIVLTQYRYFVKDYYFFCSSANWQFRCLRDINEPRRGYGGL